ncbi:NAD(P)H-binding protein [Kribbella sp. NPDC023855]|uniref:NAD(P)H-binding protein n=1 Tax=Kribbella sp. NPDC023855 TaxID=3154698 RepID=UPI0033EE6FC6
MSILITGGRGKIARAVHAGLVAQGRDVRVASREPGDRLGAIALNPADPVSLATALDGITQVFLYADPATAELFVEAAETAGVKQVVLLSSLSAQADSGNGSEDLAGDPHIGAERVIAGGAYATTRLQPGTFMSNAIFWSYQLRASGQIRLPYLDAEEAPIHEQDIADVALKVLLDGPGGAHDGAVYPMTGPESMTRRHQLGLITEVTGVPVEVVELTPDQAFEEMSSTMRDPARLALLMAYWASRVGSPHPLEQTVELVTGHPARTFTQWLHDNPTVYSN